MATRDIFQTVILQMTELFEAEQNKFVHVFFAVLSRFGLVLTLYLSVSNNCFIFLITNKTVTISLTVGNLFTNVMSKSTFTKHKIFENLIA
jgi:hypothetical protein